jgi:hypothetical protein
MEILFVVLVVVVAAGMWFAKRGTTATPTAVAANLPGPGTFEFVIVGESHYQDALEAICGGRTEESAEQLAEAVLVLEDSNPHDNMAVRVYIGGDTVGYLKSDARAYRRQLRELGHPNITCKCKAMVVGGWQRPGGDVGSFGVKLDLPVT